MFQKCPISQCSEYPVSLPPPVPPLHHISSILASKYQLHPAARVSRRPDTSSTPPPKSHFVAQVISSACPLLTHLEGSERRRRWGRNGAPGEGTRRRGTTHWRLFKLHYRTFQTSLSKHGRFFIVEPRAHPRPQSWITLEWGGWELGKGWRGRGGVYSAFRSPVPLRVLTLSL
ncbi:hypothetical protein BV22DRAFT_724951 [Leucogyrophana mollusca]|uniref:Uncharacterized protein n=1 Tax=Leucogyrophana mollusca TaxID=85980 RepID=A0ACB8B7A9_9AGAM|nr:hypothetical protein BV22DRAFT_724951 [Leucogyrophana mollusca]